MTDLSPRSVRLVERWLLWDAPSFSHLFLFCVCVLSLIPLLYLTDFPFLSVPQVFIICITQVSGLLGTVLDSLSVFPESHNLAQIESPDSSECHLPLKREEIEREGGPGMCQSEPLEMGSSQNWILGSCECLHWVKPSITHVHCTLNSSFRTCQQL